MPVDCSCAAIAVVQGRPRNPFDFSTAVTRGTGLISPRPCLTRHQSLSSLRKKISRAGQQHRNQIRLALGSRLMEDMLQLGASRVG